MNDLKGRKEKLLILVDWFAPGYKAGGPIQSCVNISLTLGDEYEVFVLTSDRDLGEDEPYPGIATNCWTNNFHPNIKVYYVSKKDLRYRNLKEIILATDADIVYLNHLFSPMFVVVPLWLKYRNLIRGKLVLCPRGGLYKSALNIKSYKKKPFITALRFLGIHRIIRFHATNEREENAVLKYFPGSDVTIADNLPNSMQLPFQSIAKEKGKLECIFIARIHPIKNLLFFLKLLVQVRSFINLTIIGPVEDQQYWYLCERAIQELPGNVEVNYIGSVPNENLGRFLTANHIFVSTTTGENFGHAIFEAFLAGRPVLISDQTPWQKLQTAGIGWELPLKDLKAFVSALESAANWDQETFDQYARSAWDHAHRFINDPGLKKQYLQLFS